MIRFTDKDWERIRTVHKKLWNNELGRPVLPMVLSGADPGRSCPNVPSLSFTNCYDLSLSPEAIVDRYDYDLSCLEYHGDSFPVMQMAAFGPGVMAAFLGAKVSSSPSTVWFFPPEKLPIEEIHPTYDPDNIWLNRVKDIYRAGMKKWGGNVCMAMIDLGGVLDVIASLLTTEDLLYALFDSPEEVDRLVREISDLWLRFYQEICEIIKDQQGFTDWSGIYSPKPSYMLQSDFSYMISPEMFQRFVGPELSRTSRSLFHPFYHLDGIGQLKHLDTLLDIESIHGIQWVPGDGDPVLQDWSEVYKKIDSRGKKIQAYYDFDSYLDDILKVITHPDSLIKMQFSYPIEKKEEAIARLARYM